MSKAHIFTVGGTVQAGSGLYIPRQADEELLALCRAGTFAYILSPRQMGKSSLMVRTAEQLSGEGIQSVIIDLTQLGVQLTVEEWYLGLLAAIEDQLTLETDVVEWWQAHSHTGMAQRLTLFFQEVLLSEITVPVVIFVDEIDTTLSLSFTDDFYAAVRYLYNARAHIHAFRRLSFVLIGVATPSDLIRDPQRTPFNIGERVDLTDWTFDEALPLAEGLNLQRSEAREVLGWILKWTGGHPYLTQHLCRIITTQGRSAWSETDVDRIVAHTFIRGRNEDNNLQFVRDMLTKRAPDSVGTLTTYREIRRGRPVYDEEQSLIKAHLKLSGVVRRERGALCVRNPIYGEVFDASWIKEHLPVNWTRRLQRTAVALVIILLVLSLPLSFYAINRAVAAESQRTRADENAAKLQSAMLNLQAALDEAKQERARAIQQQEIAEQGSLEAKRQRLLAEQERQKAIELRKTAEVQRLEAVKQRLIADQRSEEAVKQRQEAERQRQKADSLRVSAENNGREIEQRNAGNNADQLFSQGDYEQAMPLYHQFLEFLKKKPDPDYPNLIKSLTNLAFIYSTKENNAQAEALYKEALKLSRGHLELNDSATIMVMESYAIFLRKLDRDADAAVLERRLMNIRSSGGLTGEFSGVVFSSRLNARGQKQPIDRAIVRFVNQESGIPSATRTGSAGHFVKANLLPGTYRISISANGFKPIEIQATLIGGQSMPVSSKDIMLDPESESLTTR